MNFFSWQCIFSADHEFFQLAMHFSADHEFFQLAMYFSAGNAVFSWQCIFQLTMHFFSWQCIFSDDHEFFQLAMYFSARHAFRRKSSEQKRQEWIFVIKAGPKEIRGAGYIEKAFKGKTACQSKGRTIEVTNMKILATGGTGYIGSHTCTALLEQGHEVIAVDNLYNSSEEAIRRIRQITGKDLKFYEADVCSREQMEAVFAAEPGIDAVMHFAGYKAVGESVEKPLEYYSNNLNSTVVLTGVMREHGCKNIIFSSSATVYGEDVKNPLTEEAPKGKCSNPYGWTKWMIEQILTDLHTSDPEWNVVLLRYFNPIGAHPSGLIGEDPKGIPNNLLPYVAQVAIGKREELGVFGNDYNTHDGTGVRDYVHVMDLAYGHVAALKRIRENCGVDIYNLGTGQGSSVLDVVHSFEKACGHPIPYSIKPRRPGDIDANWCDPSKAERELGWTAKYNLDDMCRDSWNWQSKNPDGYGK